MQIKANYNGWSGYLVLKLPGGEVSVTEDLGPYLEDILSFIECLKDEQDELGN